MRRKVPGRSDGIRTDLGRGTKAQGRTLKMLARQKPFTVAPVKYNTVTVIPQPTQKGRHISRECVVCLGL